jgi:hypothetical protein
MASRDSYNNATPSHESGGAFFWNVWDRLYKSPVGTSVIGLLKQESEHGKPPGTRWSLMPRFYERFYEKCVKKPLATKYTI